jgi:xanthine dehydrogenase accessory factor
MSIDGPALRAAVAAHGRLVRVVIVGHEGSSPREDGADMLVWEGGQSGTIGGGALEWQAMRRARQLLADGGGSARVERTALGPALGQCCGGAVTLVFEPFDAGRLAALAPSSEALLARPVEAGAPASEPLAVTRLRAAARSGRGVPAARLVDGWLVEPWRRPARSLWVWGAGHVGRAVVSVAAPLPDFAITWVDCARGRFPDAVPEGVTVLVAQSPADLVAQAPAAAEHLILTYSHALDLELCHRLLGHGFAGAGLIGSRSKWARFRTRLRALGHRDDRIAAIACPIGAPALGKHPQAIALGVVAGLLTRQGVVGQKEGRAG